MWRAWKQVVMVLGLGYSLAAGGAEASVEDWLQRARTAQSQGLMKRALELAGGAVEAYPGDLRTHYFQVQLLGRLQQWPELDTALTRALALAPEEPGWWWERGLVRLRLARFEAAVKDFDRHIALRPAREAEMWPRGIALFYLGRWGEARRQFEIHGKVNPRDVENSAWHFACVAKLEGVESARKAWLPVTGDRRVPMTELGALMAGTGTVEAVWGVVRAMPAGTGRATASMYAHLYLALYYGALGQKELEARHAAEAAGSAGVEGIMRDIARLHVDWLAAELAKGSSALR
jgi:tetratricopeptide (TPR) repeat protein